MHSREQGHRTESDNHSSVTMGKKSKRSDGSDSHGNTPAGDIQSSREESPPDESTPQNALAALSTQDTETLFAKFDTDGSGTISFQEFREMLPQLGIYTDHDQIGRASCSV